jgi:uncharacterized protein
VPAADVLREVVDDIAAVDQHAHLLAGADSGFDLPDVLTESTDPVQVRQVRDHPAHVRARRDLATLPPGPPGETFEARTRRLIAACRLEAMLVDDGFRFPGVLALEDHAALVGCPVRRILRLETVAESAARGWPGFAIYRERVRTAIEEAVDAGAAAFKTIAAYRCGLDLPRPDVDAASAGYDRWRTTGTPRLAEPAVVSLLLLDALDVVRADPVPLQVHTGVGDRDLALHRANPTLLRPLLEDERWAGWPIVLLHCYPFVAQASYLAAMYAHVHLDLSLTVTLVPHRAAELVVQALDLAPATKLLFATDASRLPEAFLLGTWWWRDALARGLGRLVDDGVVDHATAARWSGLVLAGNASRLYRL